MPLQKGINIRDDSLAVFTYRWRVFVSACHIVILFFWRNFSFSDFEGFSRTVLLLHAVYEIRIRPTNAISQRLMEIIYFATLKFFDAIHTAFFHIINQRLNRSKQNLFDLHSKITNNTLNILVLLLQNFLNIFLIVQAG